MAWRFDANGQAAAAKRRSRFEGDVALSMRVSTLRSMIRGLAAGPLPLIRRPLRVNGRQFSLGDDHPLSRKALLADAMNSAGACP
jgi:hypothetical protein